MSLAAAAIVVMLPFLVEGRLGESMANVTRNNSQQPDTCSNSEYCCPDAMKCLKPSKISCKGNPDACTGGAICCPLTELCVMVGNACTPSHWEPSASQLSVNSTLVNLARLDAQECCGRCDNYCSPVSGNCHSEKHKSYYKDCSQSRASGEHHEQGSQTTCLGSLSVGGLGQVKVVATKWDKPGEPANVVDLSGGQIHPHVKGRAYFAKSCGDSNSYEAVKLLGKTLSYTTDLSQAGCGCNAAMYLVQMHKNNQITSCEDFYCDANAVCGANCMEVDVQEANKHAWHTALHSAYDANGMSSGFGGWVVGNKYDFDSSKYGPGSHCIDTTRPFRVEAHFPHSGGIEVTLQQHGCSVSTGLRSYPGMDAITKALAEGVTPVVSYWKKGDMAWMDGPGMGEGPCASDSMNCGASAEFYDFSVH